MKVLIYQLLSIIHMTSPADHGNQGIVIGIEVPGYIVMDAIEKSCSIQYGTVPIGISAAFQMAVSTIGPASGTNIMGIAVT